MRRDLRVNRLRPGFSLLELLVAMIVGSIVTLSVFGIISSENGRLAQQRELSDTWLTLRSAMELLLYDLRQTSANGDLSSISSTSFTVRSVRGSGVVCAKNGARYGLTDVAGDFTATMTDSVRTVSVESAPVWRAVNIGDVTTTPSGMGVGTCAWTGAPAATIGVRLSVASAADTSLVGVGSVMLAFRSTQYGVMTSGGRQWLGRKVSNGSWEIVTGPLQSSGLQFTYYTGAGATTLNAAQVAAVRVTLRSESYGRNNLRNNVQDTLSMRVALRN